MGVVCSYGLTALLVAGIIVHNPGEWREMLASEGTAFGWLSCSLLLGCSLLAALTGLVGWLQEGPARPKWRVTACWFACALAFAFADADERFIIHEYTGQVGFRGEGWEVAPQPLLLVYLAAAPLFGVMVMRRYRRSKAAKALFVAGVSLFALSAVLDGMVNWIPLDVPEELAEFGAETSFMSSFYIALLVELSRLLRSAAHTAT